jgi:hypothetical protein
MKIKKIKANISKLLSNNSISLIMILHIDIINLNLKCKLDKILEVTFSYHLLLYFDNNYEQTYYIVIILNLDNDVLYIITLLN